MLYHVFEDSQWTANMKNVDRYLLHLAVKKLLQHTQTKIYTLKFSFKTQLKDWFFCTK